MVETMRSTATRMDADAILKASRRSYSVFLSSRSVVVWIILDKKVKWLRTGSRKSAKMDANMNVICSVVVMGLLNEDDNDTFEVRIFLFSIFKKIKKRTMPCPRCRRLREFETAQRTREEESSNNDDILQGEDVEENYFYLDGLRQPSFKYLNPYDQCFCRDQALLAQERRNTGIEIPGKCFPVDMCSNCDINYSGLCPQQNKYDSGIYVNEIPVYPIISPYARPIYYPHSRWYPHTPFQPTWYPAHGYRPDIPRVPKNQSGGFASWVRGMMGSGQRKGGNGGGRR